MAVNEFRQDLVSGDWVLISSLRAKRPHDDARSKLHQDPEHCVFEPARMAEQSQPLLVYANGKPMTWSGQWDGAWTTVVVKNKFPALGEGQCGKPVAQGPFLTQQALGFHELVITRDHDRHFAQFTVPETAEVLMVYRDRSIAIARDECGEHVSIFHNHGSAAGASVYHNHSQILSTPMVPPQIVRSMTHASEYQKKHGTPIHQAMIDWEVQQSSRIVYENEQFIAFCPFASKAGYEVRIFPKRQTPYFDRSTDQELLACADALTIVLRKLFAALNDVDYNFYIHTAPSRKDPALDTDAYHWHIEIVPRIPIAAGFELSTAIYINPFDPDECAKVLREV
jgi:UDPglucose--hexose-1-phosphate uridylyltransferase